MISMFSISSILHYYISEGTLVSKINTFHTLMGKWREYDI